MGEEKKLKSGWTWVRLGDLCDQISERIDNPATSGYERFVGLEHMDSGSAKINRWGSCADVTSSMKLFKAGDSLVARRNVYLKRASQADFDGVCSGDAIVVRVKNDTSLLQDLLPFLLDTNHFWEYALANAAGSMSKRLSVQRLLNYEFALPPLEEQRRIVNLLLKLENVDNCFDISIQNNRKILYSYLENHLNNWRKSLKAVKVKKICKEDTKNGFSPKTTQEPCIFLTVSISSIQDSKFVPEGNLKYADIERSEVERFFVNENDVFVIRGNGNRYLAGKSGLAQKTYSNLFYPDLLIRVRFDEDVVLPRFGVLMWNSPSIHRRLIAKAKSTNGIWKINGQDIKEHQLFVPPIAIQKSVLSDVEKLEATSESLKQRQVEANNMKQHILNALI